MKIQNGVSIGLIVILTALLILSYQSSIHAKNKLAELELNHTTLNSFSEKLRNNITELNNKKDNLEWKNKRLTDNPECVNSKGNWTTFANPCSEDSCDNILYPPAGCIQIVVDGCDCGSERCWNGTTCILNPVPTASNVSDIIKINASVEDNFDIPKSLTPYDSSELRSITQTGKKSIGEVDNTIYDALRREVKTFFGEEYVKFETKLEEIGSSQNSQEFLFSGTGCIADSACDRYHLRFNYENDSVKIIENAVAWTGVPTKYQKLALMIVERDEPQIIEKTDRNPDIRWVPEQYGNLTLVFVNHLSGIPESPHAWLTINVEQQKILSISKLWWQ